MTNNTTTAFGRPTDYKPEFCEKVIELGKLGKSVTQMACGLGVSKQTLHNWKKTYPEFFDAITYATELSQDWWESIGQEALFAEKFQSAVYNKQMACRFRDDYSDKVINELAGNKEQPLEMKISWLPISNKQTE